MADKRSIKNDLIFISALILLALIFFLGKALLLRNDGERAEVSVDNKLYGSYDLSKDQTVTIDSSHGKNILVIKDGSVYMKDADCPDKICVKTGTINKENETIVCLPHKLVVTIVSGDEKSEYDSISK